MIDIREQIGSVDRRLGDRVLDGREARVLTIGRSFDTPVEDLWEACTDPERIRRWFLPVSGDLRPGGRYRIEGNASGVIERCDPPRGFSATWEYGGQVSWIEARISEEPGGRARFELDHIAHVDDRWGEFGPGAVGIGWDGALLGLTLYLTTGEGMDPKEAEAWMTSEEGRAFYRLSGDAWCEADIASGTDKDKARAASQRTIAFYTGEAAAGQEPAGS